MDLAGRTSLTHARRRRVGRREATRGEDNVRRVLQNQSVFYIYYIHLLHVRNYTPANVCYSG